MSSIVRAGAALLFLVACGAQARNVGQGGKSQDEELQATAARFIARYLEIAPVDATTLGEHRFDGRWPRVGAEGDAEQRAFITDMRAELARLDNSRLGADARLDRALVEAQLASWTFELDRLQSWRHEPLFYTNLIGNGLDPLVTRDFAPLAVRVESLRQRLQGVPAIVAVARASLAHPSKVATETAIQQAEGLVGFVDKELPAELAKAPERAAAVAALKELASFYKNELLARSDGDFRRGPDIFRDTLRHDLGAELPPEELYASARATLERTQEEMVATGAELWPELFPGKPRPDPKSHEEKMAFVKSVLDKLAEDRPDNKTIVEETRKIIGQATDFVRQKDLMEVPDEPLRVIEVPEYKRGVAVGYCESSGPLEAKKETVVAISPTPWDWPPARVESFYREYNRSMVAEFAIHEAMPGHFLQIAHANRVHDQLRAILSSGAFAEGWAVYGEWLMARNGFGGARVRMARQKMMLRVAANAILDHDVHAGKMTREEAMKLMLEQALQEEGEAAGKWRRAQLTCGQLSTYFYGYHEIMKLRERAEKQPGFAERAFNDKVLSFGSPPPRYLGHLVLGDKL